MLLTTAGAAGGRMTLDHGGGNGGGRGGGGGGGGAMLPSHPTGVRPLRCAASLANRLYAEHGEMRVLNGGRRVRTLVAEAPMMLRWQRRLLLLLIGRRRAIGVIGERRRRRLALEDVGHDVIFVCLIFPRQFDDVLVIIDTLKNGRADLQYTNMFLHVSTLVDSRDRVQRCLDNSDSRRYFRSDLCASLQL